MRPIVTIVIIMGLIVIIMGLIIIIMGLIGTMWPIFKCLLAHHLNNHSGPKSRRSQKSKTKTVIKYSKV